MAPTAHRSPVSPAAACGPDHRRDAAEAKQDADELGRRHPFVGRGEMRDEQREDRRRGVQDRSGARAEPRGGIDDQRERQDVVDEAHDCVAEEHRGPRRIAAAGGEHEGVQHQRREADADQHQREDRNLRSRDLDEDERCAPQEREREQKRPAASVRSCAGDGPCVRLAHACPLPPPDSGYCDAEPRLARKTPPTISSAPIA